MSDAGSYIFMDPYTLNVGSGGHDPDYWSGHLEMYLRWYAADW